MVNRYRLTVRRFAARGVAALFMSLALSWSSWPAAAGQHDIVEIYRAIKELQEQNRALTRRLATLEAELEAERAMDEQAPRPRPARLLVPLPTPMPAPMPALRRKIEQTQAQPRPVENLKPLEERVKELEDAKSAQEDATRSIIRDSLSTLGSKISECCAFGGTFEVLAGAAQVFQGRSERELRLSTAELDFEIQVNDWTLGSMVIAYDDGRDTLFLTSEGSEESVDRINLDTGFLTFGNPQRFPPFLTAGRIVLPFGISTGNPVSDVLTIGDPLTIEAFETKEDAILIGVEFPTPPLTPATPPVIPPRVRPLVINPFVRSVSRALGFKAWPPPPPTPITATPAPPLFNGGIYIYNGDTREDFQGDWRPSENFGATLGFRTKGHCGRPFYQLHGSVFCPWSIDIDVDYNNSVFDSLFLESEYRDFLFQLDQRRGIGFVPGMAVSVKSTLGPVSLIGEWNGAITDATFTDGLGNPVSIRPSAWGVSLGYQLDWNPWVEAIGEQGTYLTMSYSESNDLAGVTQVFQGAKTRVGSVPKRRLLVGAGEWVLENLRLAIEYSYNEDYSKFEGGTGRDAHGVFSVLTVVW